MDVILKCVMPSLLFLQIFRGNMFGLVDYEDEDDVPMNLGSYGKDGGEVSNSLLLSVPLTDPILPNLEDITIESPKRKSLSASELLLQNDAAAPKRQKPGKGQAAEHPSSQNNLTGMDDSVGCATGAEVLTSAELMKVDSEAPTSPGSPAPRPDSVKLFPYEESKSAQLLGNGLATDPDSYPSTKQNHIAGGDSSSVVDAYIAEAVPCSNGNVNLSRHCLKMQVEVVGTTVNGPANSGSEKVTSHVCEVSASPELHEDQNLQNGAMVTDGNEGESGVKPVGMVRNIQAGKCTDAHGAVDLIEQRCNGNAMEDVERVELGTSPIKGNIVISGVTEQLSNGSLDGEVKKLTSLGSDLMMAVTPTSPGAYTVR